MTNILEKIFIHEFEGNYEIRFSWSNDRHHAVMIQYPHGPEQVAAALLQAAHLIHRDKYLRTNAETGPMR